MVPLVGWHKTNFDGASRGNRGIASSGGMFRNYRGFVRGCFSLTLGVNSAIYVEMMAFMVAVEIMTHKKWCLLWLESNSMILVDKVFKRSDHAPWRNKMRWRNFLETIARHRFFITYIYREGNKVAHGVPNETFSLDDFTWWYRVLEAGKSFYFKNICGMVEYRIF